MLCNLSQWARRSTAMPKDHEAVAWYAWQLWHSPATAKLHNAALPSVSASQSQAPFVSVTASRPSGEGNRLYAKLPSLERSHSRRRFPVAFAPYAPPAGALVAVVAPWHWSGASRSVLVSGLRPFLMCVPPPTLVGFAATRRLPCAGSARPPPRGSLRTARLCICVLLQN
jgi:hypothetical protein